jgi:hypothetical protein
VVAQVDMVHGSTDALLSPSASTGGRPCEAPEIHMANARDGEAPPELVLPGYDKDITAMDDEV